MSYLKNMFLNSMNYLLFAFPLLVCSATAGTADVSAYECKVLRQDAGREEADLSAPLLRRVDGSLQIIEAGDVYYTSFDATSDNLDWLELFGAQSQRGNSFVGFFQFENLSCTR